MLQPWFYSCRKAAGMVFPCRLWNGLTKAYTISVEAYFQPVILYAELDPTLQDVFPYAVVCNS